MAQATRVVLFGDTSTFHAGSAANAKGLYGEIAKHYEILDFIPYDFFFEPHPEAYVEQDRIFEMVETHPRLRECHHAEAIIVHGEGITQYDRAIAYPYVHLGSWARSQGKRSALVDFCMYEPENFVTGLRDFDYVAPRDSITCRLLRRVGLTVTPSFDCSILAVPPSQPETTVHNGKVALIRGHYQSPLKAFEEHFPCDRLNAAWPFETIPQAPPRLPFFWRKRLRRLLPKPLLAWKRSLTRGSGPTRDGVPSSETASTHAPKNAAQWIDTLREYRLVASTSFHGGIFAWLAGVPFVAPGAFASPKLLALTHDLLPKRFHRLSVSRWIALMKTGDAWRAEILAQYARERPKIEAMARANVPPF